MRPVSLTYTGTVGVTIQDVFDLISDASRMPEWLPNCVSTVPGPTNKGRGDRHFKLDFQGGTTRITMKCVWVPASWRAWLLGQFYRRRSAHKMFDGLLQNLRKALTR